jgi:hypothetical protein
MGSELRLGDILAQTASGREKSVDGFDLAVIVSEQIERLRLLAGNATAASLYDFHRLEELKQGIAELLAGSGGNGTAKKIRQLRQDQQKAALSALDETFEAAVLSACILRNLLAIANMLMLEHNLEMVDVGQKTPRKRSRKKVNDWRSGVSLIL